MVEAVDTDTSTSDTAVVLASGVAGMVDLAAFEAALYDVCASLAQQIARDGDEAMDLFTILEPDLVLLDLLLPKRDGFAVCALCALQDAGS